MMGSAVRVICDHVTGKSRGYGFVRFTSAAAASAAIQDMNGQVGYISIRIFSDSFYLVRQLCFMIYFHLLFSYWTGEIFAFLMGTGVHD